MSMTDVSWLFVPALLLLLAGGYLQQRKSRRDRIAGDLAFFASVLILATWAAIPQIGSVLEGNPGAWIPIGIIIVLTGLFARVTIIRLRAKSSDQSTTQKIDS